MQWSVRAKFVNVPWRFDSNVPAVDDINYAKVAISFNRASYTNLMTQISIYYSNGLMTRWVETKNLN